MPELERLPTELHLEILSHLDPVKDKTDLMSLCRTSRYFRKLAQPFLFKVYTNKGCFPSCNTRDFGSLALFTRSLLCRPDLRRAVHQISIRAAYDDYGRKTLTLWPETFSPDTLGVITGGLQKLNVNYMTKAYYSMTFRLQDISTLLIILFANLWRLEEFRIAFYKEESRRLLSILNFCAVGSSYMPNLTFLRLSANSHDIRLARILRMMCLPRLRHFGVSHCVGDYRDIPASGLRRGSMNFSSLFLDDCYMDRTALSNIITACKRVESLTYVTCGTFLEKIDAPLVGTEDLNQILSCQRDSLTMLNVSLADTNWDYWDLPSKFEPPFTFFTNLKTLHVDQGYLGKTPEFPESLQTLLIGACDDPIFDLLGHLVKENHRFIPILGDVIIKPERSPCTGILEIYPTFSKDEFYEDDSRRELFKERVRKLENIVSKGRFRFRVNCGTYQACCYDDGFSEGEVGEFL